MSVLDFYQRVEELIKAGESCVVVSVVDVIGSVPQEAGARMLVTRDGRVAGTVGGGKIEVKAIGEARTLLEQGPAGDIGQKPRTRFVTWHLERDVGMTCGGSMRLFFEVFDRSGWSICIFGAGHCAQALVHVLLNLDCQIKMIDTREDWLQKAPRHPKLRTISVKNYVDGLDCVEDRDYVLLLSQGHSTDSPILVRLMQSYQAGAPRHPYLGAIGSKAKRIKLLQDLAAAGVGQEWQEAFYCPIGLPLGTNDPQEIAISIAAQLLATRDKTSAGGLDYV